MKKKKNHVEIRDFRKIIIPKGYKLMKIGTYNTNLRSTVNLNDKIKNVTSIIFSEFKHKDLDIICLQGINDYNSAYSLIQEIKTIMESEDEQFYFAPDFEDVAPKKDSFPFQNRSAKGPAISWNTKLSSNDDGIKFNSVGNFGSKSKKSRDYQRKTQSQNIILSKYPIVSTIYAELDDNTDFDDIIGTHTVIGANISVSGNIISVFNTLLSKDIRSANIVNSDIRNREIKAIFNVIKQNSETLKDKEFITYNKTDINILIGSLNINEMSGNEMSEEFTRFISERHCVDIYRYLTDDKLGFTNTTRERLNYILMILTDDIYEEDSRFNKKLQNLETAKDLFNFIFDRYGIYFLDIYVRTDIVVGGGQNNYPVECAFMINKNKH